MLNDSSFGRTFIRATVCSLSSAQNGNSSINTHDLVKIPGSGKKKENRAITTGLGPTGLGGLAWVGEAAGPDLAWACGAARLGLEEKAGPPALEAAGLLVPSHGRRGGWPVRWRAGHRRRGGRGWPEGC